jgi:hypothetical protein
MGLSSTRRLLAGAVAAAALIGGCGGDDDGDGGEPAQRAAAAPAAGITEDALPQGFTKTPTVKQNGKEWTFDNVPGHYWKVLDDSGYTVGLHFQTDEPFPWAKDVKKGELLYLVYAIPGNCGNGSFEQAVKAKDATILGPTPAGFDHWHGLVGAGPKAGHWLMHIPVRDFTMAGPPDNPMDGTPVKAGTPGFMPVCDIR